jgi:N,N'-diacetyllegionaminate synthase
MDGISIKSNNKKIKIGNRFIGDGEPVFIIAEAGVNHNGDPNLAKQLIEKAAAAGAGAVKFQTYHAENLVTCTAEKAGYQKNTSGSEESQYEMLKKLELPDNVFQELSDYAKEQNILFLSTPFDEESVDLLDRIGVPAYKISSGEITNFPLLKKIAGKKKPVILSTGMATLGEVEAAFHYLKKQGAHDVILLHCTTSYPAALPSVNLRAIQTLQCAFQVPVGYSDHTLGIVIPIAAVAMGACVLEKHFTLDKSMSGPDHKASLEPDGLRAMVETIRDVESALGNGYKKPNEEEELIKKVARRSIVARQDIASGSFLKESDLIIKRPGTGIEPKYWESLLQRKTLSPIQKDQVINWDMIE